MTGPALLCSVGGKEDLTTVKQLRLVRDIADEMNKDCFKQVGNTDNSDNSACGLLYKESDAFIFGSD